MTTPQPALELHLTRVIKAKREAVFAAWTQPEILRRWFTPGGRGACEASLDPRAGGAYRIGMSGTGCDGAQKSVAAGVYTEISPYSRIQFTWTFEHKPEADTLVTVEFREVEGGTELTLTHQGFTSDADCANHERGWTSILDALANYAGEADYVRFLEIAAPAERVYAALATVAGPSRWWSSRVSGSAEAGGVLQVDFAPGSHVRMRVARAESPNLVVWEPIECTPAPDWVGTSIIFSIAPRGEGRCALSFRHAGLTPQVECFEMCQSGWDRYLPSLAAEAERGEGRPRVVG